MIHQPLSKGQLYIADEVVAMIITSTLSDIKGLYGVSSGMKEQLVYLFKRKGTKGISLSHYENGINIDIKVSVAYGMKIHQVCYQLQRFVKEQVEALIGVKVNAVNIQVESLYSSK